MNIFRLNETSSGILYNTGPKKTWDRMYRRTPAPLLSIPVQVVFELLAPCPLPKGVRLW